MPNNVQTTAQLYSSHTSKVMLKILQVRLKIFIDTKGTFHAKMSSIKDGNGMDLTEAEDIKKRW